MAAITFTSSPSINQTRTSNGITWTWTGTKWRSGGASSSPVATGAVTYPFGTDTVHAFTSSGTLTLNSTVTARILVVAGGGGGSYNSEPYSYGGGGGGGGYLYYTNISMTAGTYTITVGTGGLGSVEAAASTNGVDSSIVGGSISYTAIGGGRGGGTGNGNGGTGGSGGSAASYPGGSTNGSGTSGQGFGGGAGAGGGAWGTSLYGPPDGGPGIINDIAGFPMSFSGGGSSERPNDAITINETAYGMPGLGGGGGRGIGRFNLGGSGPTAYNLPVGTTLTSIYNSWSYGGGGAGRYGSYYPGKNGPPGFQGIVIVRYAT